MTYKAEYVDGNFETIFELNDNDALNEAWSKENEENHGSLVNFFEIDDDYEEIRTII